jgi:hypothetical protein
MNALMIKDLSITEQLDSKAMNAVRGGTGYGCYQAPSASYFNFSPVSMPNNSKNVVASQYMNNGLNIQSANADNVALASCIDTSINPCLTTSNNIRL